MFVYFRPIAASLSLVGSGTAADAQDGRRACELVCRGRVLGGASPVEGSEGFRFRVQAQFVFPR